MHHVEKQQCQTENKQNNLDVQFQRGRKKTWELCVPVKHPEHKKGQCTRYQAAKHLAVTPLAACALSQLAQTPLYSRPCWSIFCETKVINFQTPGNRDQLTDIHSIIANLGPLSVQFLLY
jgi:hypothetical protein